MAGVVVIGSGPAAVAACKVLIKRGLTPEVWDAGEKLGPKFQEKADVLQRTHGHWDMATVLGQGEESGPKRGGIPRKSVFGSDYIYGNNRPHSPLLLETDCLPLTFAKGGFSVAWGGAFLPIHDDDMQGWPFRRDRLLPFYESCLSGLPLSAVQDSLSAEFPLSSKPCRRLKMTAQHTDILQDITSAGGPMIAGQARLAVQASGDNKEGCVYCGMCLTGCPFDMILNMGQELENMVAKDQVRYRPGRVVTRLEETKNGVTVSAVDLDGTPLQEETFSQVFMAAGVIGSTRIMLESKRLFEVDIVAKDSQKFVLPLLGRRSHPIEWPNVATLPSLFIETKVPCISNHWVHMQISGINPYIIEKLAGWLGPFGSPPWRALAPFINRLSVAWGGLHSDHSGTFTLRLLRAHIRGRPVLKVQAVDNPKVSQILRKVTWAITQQGLGQGVAFLPPLAMTGNPGAGFHVGGTMPMKDRPEREMDTDVLGRPQGYQRVHIIDGAVLPSIASTTLALTIMANAQRVVTEVDMAPGAAKV